MPASRVSQRALLALVVLAGLATSAVATDAAANAGTAATSAAAAVPTQLSLASVACVTGSDCVAVGQRVTSSNRDLNVAEGWNGRRWKVLPEPASPGSQDGLDAVSCASRTACMAVGSYMVVRPAKPKPVVQVRNLAESWDGHAWKQLPTPERGSNDQLTGVSCTAPDRCVAVGWSLAGTIAESWNGSRWQLMTTQNPATDIALNSVSCASRTSCVTVGGQDFGQGAFVAEVWNGQSWRVDSPPTPAGRTAGLASVSCPTDADCIAVGSLYTLSSQPKTLAERWNGKAWRMLRPITPAGTKAGAGLHGVSCVLSRTCVAVGGADERLLGEAWNRHAWRLTSTPRKPAVKDVAASLLGISCWQSRRCIAVGDYFGVSEVVYPMAEEWNGTTWRLLTFR
jgi:hypothetical protein